MFNSWKQNISEFYTLWARPAEMTIITGKLCVTAIAPKQKGVDGPEQLMWAPGAARKGPRPDALT